MRSDEAAFLATLKGVGVSTPELPGGTEALVMRPAGPTQACLVLFHGGGNDRLFGLWYLIERMLEAGIAVVTADLPGHGRGATDLFSIGAARERLDGMVAIAQSDTGAEQTFVLGQSLGGAFALDQRARHDRAAGVIAVSVPVRLALGPRVLLELVGLFHPAAHRVLRYVPITRAWPAFGPFGRRRFPVRTESRPYLAAFRNALAELNLLRTLKGTDRRCPVLLVHGEQDGVAPSRHARQLAEVIGGAASVLRVPGASHFDPLLREDVVSHILAWMETPRSPHGGDGVTPSSPEPRAFSQP